MASKSPITCHGTRVTPPYSFSHMSIEWRSNRFFTFSLGGWKPIRSTLLRPGHTVLDSSTGEPARGIKVQLLAQSVAVQPTHSTLPALPPTHAGVWVGVGTSVTNSDGRCLDLLPPSRNADSPSGSPPSHALRPGRTYQIVFETEEYFKRTGRKSFYPFVQVRGSTYFLGLPRSD